MSDAPAPIGHNSPPVTIPSEVDMLGDLQRRYPEIESRLKEWEGALAEFPEDLSLDQEDVAGKLQDLLGQIGKTSRAWTKSDMAAEKSPLNKLLKVVGNFFTKGQEKAQALLDKWEPVHHAFLDKKRAETARRLEEEAALQREKERLAREAAERAEEEARAAEERAAEERRKEQEAREVAERAAREAEEAKARTAARLAEEKRLADEKKARDRAEKERNAESLKQIRVHMKTVEKLHQLDGVDEATPEEMIQLEDMVRHGGIIGLLAGPVAASDLLDDEQRTEIEAIRSRLNEIRTAKDANLNKREQTRREKERAEYEAQEAVAAAKRKAEREAEEKRLADAKAAREAEEAKAAKAKEEKEAANKAAREARGAARDAEGEARDLTREGQRNIVDAGRAANRATRTENRLENSTEADLSRTRGDWTTGSLTRHWKHFVTDEDALRAAMRAAMTVPVYAELVDQLNSEDLNGAVYRWMRLHQGGWDGRERVDDALAGCVFCYEQGVRNA
jgi:membrane protein involved in colicin uptake